MTPALKAMVEAMADQMPGAMISNGEVLVTGAGWVNLEKVARAGLAAIREPSADMVASGDVDFAATSDARRVWRGMVDVALTGEPSSLDATCS